MNWMLPVFALLIGVVIGLIIGRLMPSGGSGNAREKMDEMQGRFENYQGEVVDHFAATAGLVQRMNQSYQDVLNHLSEGASKLSPDDETRQRLMTSLSQPSSAPARLSKPASSGDEPPRDYAPGSGGTLSEEYSASREKKDQD